MHKMIQPAVSDRDSQIDSSTMVQWMLDPRTYHDCPSRVECIETHISWVFLTDRFVYKLKKPVVFEFLDFSTPQLRRDVCQLEVNLNRRLAADVYLGVVPITRDRRGGLRLGGEGTAVDWTVKMRRLPAERALDRMIRSRSLTQSHILQLAEKLAQFYDRLPPVGIKTEDYRRHIEQHVAANRAELLRPQHEFSPALVKRVNSAQLRLLRLAPELLDARVCDGRIIEGHGDLRPEHVYFGPTPVIIDCIEFNEEFRQIDVLDELSFLAMECDHLGARQVGTQIVEQYARRVGDAYPPKLQQFYKSYRACVRAKVLALRCEQVADSMRQSLTAESERYLRQADRYAADLGPPLLLLVRGLMGSGKSTLAGSLAESLGIEQLQTDAIRRELYGASRKAAGYHHGHYTPARRARVYQEMCRRANRLLEQGLSVVLDGTFLTCSLRSQFTSLAERHGAVSLVVSCTCPDNIAMARIAQRQAGATLSEARPELYELQQRDEEPDPDAYQVDTNESLPEITNQVLERLRMLYCFDQCAVVAMAAGR